MNISKFLLCLFSAYAYFSTLTMIVSFSTNKSLFNMFVSMQIVLRSMGVGFKTQESYRQMGFISSPAEILKSIFCVDFLSQIQKSAIFQLIFLLNLFFVAAQHAIACMSLSQVLKIPSEESICVNNLYSSYFSIDQTTCQQAVELNPSFDVISTKIQQEHLMKSQSYEPQQVFQMLLIAQIFFGLLLITLVIFDLACQKLQELLSRRIFLQLTSIFMSLLALHGILIIIWNLRHDLLWPIQLFKIFSVVLQTLLICLLKLPFLSFVNVNALRIAFIACALLFGIFPIDYAPFYQKQWVKSNYLQSYVALQVSMKIIKAFQTLEIVYLLIISQEVDGKGYVYMEGMLRIFQVAAVCSIGLACCHLWIKVKERITKNYQFFSATSLTVDEIIRILRNSKEITYFEVKSIQDMRNSLENNQEKQKELLRELIKQISRGSEEYPVIIIGKIVKTVCEGSIRYVSMRKVMMFEKAFFEELLDSSTPLPFCRLRDVEDAQIQYEFGQALILRVFTSGVCSNLQDLIKIQHRRHQTFGKDLFNRYMKDILSTIAFQHSILHILPINPSQVLHDLWLVEDNV